MTKSFKEEPLELFFHHVENDCCAIALERRKLITNAVMDAWDSITPDQAWFCQVGSNPDRPVGRVWNVPYGIPSSIGD